MKITLAILAALVLLVAWIRFAPSDPARWHVDPAAAPDPRPGGVKLRHFLPLPPAEALAAFDRVAMAAPRTRRLAGSVEEGRITYVTRTRWLGFPDYITVAAEPAEGGADLVILSRLRFGKADLGVNARRLEDLLGRLPQPIQG